LPFRPWFCIFHGQVARDLLSNWHSPAQAISLSSFRRNLSRQVLIREPESRLLFRAFWIPACAGMTDQHLSEKGNLDKTVLKYFVYFNKSVLQKFGHYLAPPDLPELWHEWSVHKSFLNPLKL
jgi:hypothetical protein